MHAPDHDKISDEGALASVESPLDSNDDTAESYVMYCVPEDLILVHCMEIREASLLDFE